MLNQIEQWIDQTNLDYQEQRVSCSKFSDEFKGFYSLEFLQHSYFLIVDTIPKPDFPELRQMGLGNFIDMDVDGITYKDTYYIKQHCADNLRLHFHELVHVAQWRKLGAINFIQRYISEINTYSYSKAPLEEMAYFWDAHFSKGGDKIDIPRYVSQKL